MERQPNPQETKIEKIPAKEEVLSEIGRYCENPKVVQERADEKGLFYLVAQVPGEKPGDVIEYTYMREGDFGGTVSGRTSIVVAHVEGGEVVWGEDKAHYDAQTKKWEHL